MNRNSLTVTRKERRRDRRRQLQIEVLLGGQQVQLTDLSAAGFGAAIDATERRPHDFRVGQRLRLELRPAGGEALSLAVENTRPVGENGLVRGTFVELSDPAYHLLQPLLPGHFHRPP